MLFFSLFPTNFANLHIVFSWMTALEHNFDIWWLKLSWLSISIPSNFTDLIVSISYYIFLILPSFIHNNSLKPIRIGYHVIVLKPIYRWFWFFFKCTEESLRFLQVSAMVSSSAKLCKSDFVSYKNKSFIKILNRIGPSINPCGTPERYIVNFHTLLLMLVIIEKSVSKSRPYARSLAIRRSFSY